MALLNQRMALHDVRDVEALCISVFKSRAPAIPARDHEAAIAYLIETAWELSHRYDPGDRPSRFGFYTKRILARRLVDWQRSQYGRTRWSSPNYVYERPRIALDRLDDVAGGQLERALASRDGDYAPDWNEDGRGLYDERDRERATDLELLDLAPDR